MVCLFSLIIKLIDLERVVSLFGVTAPLNITVKTSTLHYFANGRKDKSIAGDQGSECLDSKRTCNCVNNSNKKYKK